MIRAPRVHHAAQVPRAGARPLQSAGRVRKGGHACIHSHVTSNTQYAAHPAALLSHQLGSPFFETRHLLGCSLGMWQTPRCEAHHSFHTPIHEDTMLPKAMPAAQPRGADTGAPLACANPQQLPRPVTYLPQKRQSTCVHVLCRGVGAAKENRRHCSEGNMQEPMAVRAGCAAPGALRDCVVATLGRQHSYE